MSLMIDQELLVSVPKKHYIPPENFKLCTRKFNSHSQRWNKYNYQEEASKQKKYHQFSVIEYNIYGALKYDQHPYEVSKRLQILPDELRKYNADFIILHEVSKKILSKLLTLDWVRQHYYISECNVDRVQTMFGIGSVIFSKVPFLDFRSYGFPGYDMYALSLGIFMINEHKVALCGSQYHSSKSKGTFRKAQFHATMNILEELYQKEKVTNFIWASDFNYDLNNPQKWSESSYMSQLQDRYSLGHGWVDVWKKKYPKLPGFTENTDLNEMRKYMLGNIKRLKEGISKFHPEEVEREHKQVRFDAIFINSSVINMQDIKIIGTQGKTISGVKVYPSDHFGLYGQFKLFKPKQVAKTLKKMTSRV